MSDDEITKEEFCRRFVERMIQNVGPEVEGYAKSIAVTYFDDADQRDCGPEECADEEVSCWDDDEP